MNDSFRTDVFVRWPPETIACACIWLAARQLQVGNIADQTMFQVSLKLDLFQLQDLLLLISFF